VKVIYLGLDKLPDKIAATAKKEANSILSEAKAEAKSITNQAKEASASISEESASRASKEAEQIAREAVASSRQSNQKDLLIARREELDTTHAMLVKQVSSPSLAGRASLLKRLLLNAKNVADKDMILRPVALDRDAIESAGSIWDIGDDIDGMGGFILHTKDQSFSLDFRFETVLKNVWESKLSEVNETLFASE
jgi:V/A-type H+-transporting ATPase subunit E